MGGVKRPLFIKFAHLLTKKYVQRDMKKVNKLILMVINIIITGISANAASIKGYIYDKKTNEPVIGAIVMLMNQNIGVHTDFDGRFVISDVQSGKDRLHVKSIGHCNYTQDLIIAEDSVAIDVGIIYLKKAMSKHYNRLSLSYNPQLIPTICPHQKLFYDSYKVIGVTFSYLHGYNFSDKFSVELGAKSNITIDDRDKDQEQSIEMYDRQLHSTNLSLSVFANLAYNIAINNVTISPYVGVFTRSYLISEFRNDDNYVVYDVDKELENRWFNPGAQVGVGFKYRKLYLGAELGCDLDQERIYFMEPAQGNPDKFYFEYSFTVGIQF